MADVRSASGAATATSVFTGPPNPYAPGTPIYVDTATGDLYVLATGDTIVKISASVAAGVTVSDADLHISNQVFNRYVAPLSTTTTGSATVTVENADLQNAVKAFHPIITYPQDVADANEQLANRAFARPAPTIPPVNTNEQIGNQIFAQHNPISPKDVGDANEQLANRSFSQKTFTTPPANTNEQLGAQIFARHNQPSPPVANTNEQLGTQVFARHSSEGPVDVGDANMVLAQRAFGFRQPTSASTSAAATVSVTIEDASLQIGNRTFAAPQAAAPFDSRDANQQLTNRSLALRLYAQADAGDANQMLASRSFGWRFFAPPVVTVYSTVNPEDSQINLAVRVYDRAPQVAVLGDANDMIRAMAFASRVFSAPMTFASSFEASRAFRQAQLPAMWS